MEIATRRLAALFVLGGGALVPPVLSAFNRPAWVGDLPLLPLYLFFVWALLVFGAAFLGRSR